MASIKTIYLGDLSVKSTHLKSNTLLETDAPVDNNGKGESFSPTDLVVASLCSCMITIMGIRANKSGFELKRCEASLTKHMLSDPRRIGKIEIDMELDDIYTDKEKKILEAAAETCPVALSLHPELVQDLKIRYV